MKYMVILDALENRAKVIELDDTADVLHACYEHMACECIQLLPVYDRQRLSPDYVVLTDEELYGKLCIVNPIASWLYGADVHGATISNNCAILKEVPEDMDFMPREEAEKLAAYLNAKADDIFTELIHRAVKTS